METETANQPVAGLGPQWKRVVLGRRPTWTIARVAALIGVTFVLFKFIFIPIQVVGNSMVPTYHNGSIKLVNRNSYSRTPPKRGDVVAIRLPGTKVMELKRIIGLPGETVRVDRKGNVHINGEPLEEPYLPGTVRWTEGSWALSPNQYFVAGDNRRISEFGAVERERIVGRVVF
jgi:signal peptidase I